MTHLPTSPHYPQCNGKLGSWHHSLKSEGTRPLQLFEIGVSMDGATLTLSGY
jgi:hypothetical protein